MIFTSRTSIQYSNLVIIAVITAGIAIFVFIECLTKKKMGGSSGSKDFEMLDDFQFSERDKTLPTQGGPEDINNNGAFKSYQTNQDSLGGDK